MKQMQHKRWGKKDRAFDGNQRVKDEIQLLSMDAQRL
jgi:hypothetical protein